MIYDVTGKKYKSYQRFECGVCLERWDMYYKMPNLTSCKCAGNICVRCFCKDFDARQHLHWVHKDSVNESGVSKCEEQGHSDEMLFLAFYTDFYQGFNDNDNICMRGRTCPFCKVLQLWDLDETPRMIQGRLKLYAPMINWNAT